MSNFVRREGNALLVSIGGDTRDLREELSKSRDNIEDVISSLGQIEPTAVKAVKRTANSFQKVSKEVSTVANAVRTLTTALNNSNAAHSKNFEVVRKSLHGLTQQNRQLSEEAIKRRAALSAVRSHEKAMGRLSAIIKFSSGEIAKSFSSIQHLSDNDLIDDRTVRRVEEKTQAIRRAIDQMQIRDIQMGTKTNLTKEFQTLRTAQNVSDGVKREATRRKATSTFGVATANVTDAVQMPVDAANFAAARRALSEMTSEYRKLQRLAREGIVPQGEMAKFKGELDKATNSVSKMGIELKKLDNKSFMNSFSRMWITVAKLTGVVWAFITAGRMLKQMFNSTTGAYSDLIEAQNLYNVSLGRSIDKGNEFVALMSDGLGYNPKEIMQAQGNLMQLTQSMGIAHDTAYMMAEGLTALSYDMASFKNMTTAESIDTMTSAIVGEARAARRFGIDITEASLAETAHRLGVEKSIKTLDQATKAQLRFITMIQQSTLAQGDMANTLNQPANMLRVLKSQFEVAAQTLGSVFIPALASILPYAIAAVQGITALVVAFMSLFGIELPKYEFASPDTSGFLGDMEAAEKATGGTAKQMKKMRDYAMGIDELNVMPKADSGSGGGGGGGGAAVSAPDLSGFVEDAYKSYMDAFKKAAEGKVAEITKGIRDKFLELAGYLRPVWDSLVNLWETGLVPTFEVIGKVIKSVYEQGVRPLVSFIMQSGLPAFIDLIAASFAVLQPVFTVIANFLGGIIVGFLETIRIVLEVTTVIVDFAARVLNAIAEAFNIEPLRNFWDGVGKVVFWIGVMIGTIISLAKVVYVFGNMVAWIKLIPDYLVAIGKSKAFVNLTKQVKNLLTVGGNIKGMFVNIGKSFADVIRKTFDWAKAMKGLTIAQTLQNIVTWFSKLAVMQGLTTFLNGVLSTSFTVLGVSMVVATGGLILIGAAIGLLIVHFESVIGWLKGVGNKFKEVLGFGGDADKSSKEAAVSYDIFGQEVAETTDDMNVKITGFGRNYGNEMVKMGDDTKTTFDKVITEYETMRVTLSDPETPNAIKSWNDKTATSYGKVAEQILGVGEASVITEQIQRAIAVGNQDEVDRLASALQMAVEKQVGDIKRISTAGMDETTAATVEAYDERAEAAATALSEIQNYEYVAADDAVETAEARAKAIEKTLKDAQAAMAKDANSKVAGTNANMLVSHMGDTSKNIQDSLAAVGVTLEIIPPKNNVLYQHKVFNWDTHSDGSLGLQVRPLPPRSLGAIHTNPNQSQAKPPMFVRHYARGGFPSMGNMFVAGEAGAEMVGKFGNNANTVMPLENTNFVTAISTAVGNAVYTAVQSANGGAGQGTQMEIKLDGVKVGTAVERAMTKRFGNKPIVSVV